MTTLNASGERVEVVDDAQVSVCRPCALAVCAAIHLDFSLPQDVQGCRMDRLTLVSSGFLPRRYLPSSKS